MVCRILCLRLLRLFAANPPQTFSVLVFFVPLRGHSGLRNPFVGRPPRPRHTPGNPTSLPADEYPSRTAPQFRLQRLPYARTGSSRRETRSFRARRWRRHRGPSVERNDSLLHHLRSSRRHRATHHLAQHAVQRTRSRRAAPGPHVQPLQCADAHRSVVRSLRGANAHHAVLRRSLRSAGSHRVAERGSVSRASRRVLIRAVVHSTFLDAASCGVFLFPQRP